MIVLDGGALVHRIIWDIGAHFRDIIDMYKHYITSKYKDFSLVTIVFDDYAITPTKDHCHRKSQPIHGMEILFNAETELSCKKGTFLSKPKNK